MSVQANTTVSDDELKACPFCGGEGAHQTDTEEDTFSEEWICCTNCGATAAIEVWDRRATADVTEAVAWQQRERRRSSDDPKWSHWYPSDKDAYDEWLAGKYGPESGYNMEYEVRALASLNPPMGR